MARRRYPRPRRSDDHGQSFRASHWDKSQLFGEPGRNVIDWDLIESHYDDLMRVALSIQAGKISSVTLLRRLSTYSRRNFAAWCRFGNGGVIADNDPDEQEKIVKFSTLLTNCVVFHTTVDMMAAFRDLIADGWMITTGDLAVLSLYLTARIQRFGVYATDEMALKPDAYDARLGVGLDLECR